MISKRLRKILEIIPKSKILADIGTDHGYIPVEAVKNNIAIKAIASDISQGSLSKAINEIRKNELETKIDARLGSGLEVLLVDEADTIVIAGMGGILICDILENEYHTRFRSSHPLLILQPVQFPEKLREYLYKNGFEISAEELIEDEGKIYHIIVSRYRDLKPQIKEEHVYELGEINIKQNSELLMILINKKIKKNISILESMEKAENEDTSQKKLVLLSQIKKYEELRKNASEKS